jgi:hypothetical protein
MPGVRAVAGEWFAGQSSRTLAHGESLWRASPAS